MGSPLRTHSLDDAEVGTGCRIDQLAYVVAGFTGSNLLDFKQTFFLNETIQQRIVNSSEVGSIKANVGLSVLSFGRTLTLGGRGHCVPATSYHSR